MNTTVPWLADAVVMSQDGANYRVYVVLQGGLGCQGPLLPVEVATQGHSDAQRGDWPPLPAVGTHGRVSFTRGDIRNGRWEGAHRSNLQDSVAHGASNPNLRYRAEFSGAWYWHGEDGTTAQAWPDGSSYLIGAAMPVPTRNVVTDQTRKATPFSAAQRNPNPPAAFPFTYTHGTGVIVSISASGAVTVSGLTSQPVSLAGGGCAIVMSGGNIVMSGVLRVTGNIVGGTGAGTNVDIFHTHGGVTTGGGNTLPPNINT